MIQGRAALAYGGRGSSATPQNFLSDIASRRLTRLIRAILLIDARTMSLAPAAAGLPHDVASLPASCYLSHASPQTRTREGGNP